MLKSYLRLQMSKRLRHGSKNIKYLLLIIGKPRTKLE